MIVDVHAEMEFDSCHEPPSPKIPEIFAWMTVTFPSPFLCSSILPPRLLASRLTLTPFELALLPYILFNLPTRLFFAPLIQLTGDDPLVLSLTRTDTQTPDAACEAISTRACYSSSPLQPRGIQNLTASATAASPQARLLRFRP